MRCGQQAKPQWQLPCCEESPFQVTYASTTVRANFTLSMDISVYSFTAVVQRAEKMMKNGGSCLTLTYYGAEKVMPHGNYVRCSFLAPLGAALRHLWDVFAVTSITCVDKDNLC